MTKLTKKELLMIVICMILIVGFGLVTINEPQRIRVIGDEFGYWGCAAFYTGIDWSELMSYMTYMGYGYGFLIAPFLALYRLGMISMATTYRCAIILNICMQVGMFFLGIRILELIFPKLKRIIAIAISMFASCYYAICASVGVAWVEVCIAFIAYVVAYYTIKSILSRNLKYYILLLIFCAYLFAVHMRTIHIFVCFPLILMGMAIQDYRLDRSIKRLLLILGSIIAYYLLMIFAYKFVCSHIYNLVSESAPINNSVVGEASRFQAMLSIEGLADLANSCAGKLWYAGVASYGIVILAVIAFIREMTSFIFHRGEDKRITNRIWGEIFAMIALIGAIAISAIKQGFRYFSGEKNGLGDGVVYGRYLDYIVIIYILIGIAYLTCNTIPRYYWYIVIAIMLALTCDVQWQWDNMAFFLQDNVVIRGTGVGGIACWLRYGYNDSLAYTTLLGGLLCSLIMVGLLGISQERIREMLIDICLVFSAILMLSFSVTDRQQWIAGKSNKEKTVQTVADIIDRTDENVSVIYLVEDTDVNGDIDILQWSMGKRPIHVKSINDAVYDLGSIYLCDSDLVSSKYTSLIKYGEYVYDSGSIAVFMPKPVETCCSDAIQRARSAVNPRNGGIVDLSESCAEYSYQRPNGYVYLDQEKRNADYLTWDTKLKLDDGLYLVRITMESNYPQAEDVGYVTFTDANREHIENVEILQSDFGISGEGVITGVMPVRDYVEPKVGIYSNGESSFIIKNIEFVPAENAVDVTIDRDEEWNEIAIYLNSLDYPDAYYVDSDDSSVTGFVSMDGIESQLKKPINKYISGSTFAVLDELPSAVYIIENNSSHVMHKNIASFETEHYYIIQVE